MEEPEVEEEAEVKPQVENVVQTNNIVELVITADIAGTTKKMGAEKISVLVA